MAVDHYENFPVASWLCPPHLRGPIASIYGFAREADDIADEGSASSEQRLQSLAEMRADVQALFAKEEVSLPSVSGLGTTVAQYQLPQRLFLDLLSAFAQDCQPEMMPDRAAVLDYCSRSANPVGRLLLHLYQQDGVRERHCADQICTGLQLVNFCQDVGEDAERGRVYLPLDLLERHGLNADDVLQRRWGEAMQAAMAEFAAWAAGMLVCGSPLASMVGGRIGIELRLVVAGGLRIAQKTMSKNRNLMTQRPRLRWFDAPSLLGLALRP